MDWGLTLIFLASIVFAWYVLLMLRWLLGNSLHSRQSGARAHTHHAVTIVADAAACQSARKLSGVRLLASKAPVLPLKGCQAADCHCVYRHFDDRRMAQRRAVIDVHGVRPDRRDKLTGRRHEDYRGLMPG